MRIAGQKYFEIFANVYFKEKKINNSLLIGKATIWRPDKGTAKTRDFLNTKINKFQLNRSRDIKEFKIYQLQGEICCKACGKYRILTMLTLRFLGNSFPLWLGAKICIGLHEVSSQVDRRQVGSDIEPTLCSVFIYLPLK